jgi:hypothetical protein
VGNVLAVWCFWVFSSNEFPGLVEKRRVFGVFGPKVSTTFCVGMFLLAAVKVIPVSRALAVSLIRRGVCCSNSPPHSTVSCLIGYNSQRMEGGTGFQDRGLR